MNEKFRWFVIEDNFLDKEECGSLIKQIDENGIRTHDDTSDDDSDFIHRREVDPTIENDPYYHKKNQVYSQYIYLLLVHHLSFLIF